MEVEVDEVEVDEVRPWLLVGNGAAASDWRGCIARGVTRFLRVGGGPPPPMNRLRPGGVRIAGDEASASAVSAAAVDTVEESMSVDIDDDDDADLLSLLPQCHAFIKRSKPDEDAPQAESSGRRRGGAVLVYCSAGMSRSQAVVASFIMHEEGVCLNEALTQLPQHASPNENFLAQLLLLEKMGGSVDVESRIYRAFRQKRLARRALLYGYFDSDKVSAQDYGSVDDDSLVDVGASPLGSSSTHDAKASVVYRCRKCRRVVASSSNEVGHGEADGDRGGARRAEGSADVNGSGGNGLCHIYTEAMAWMREELEKGQLEGKLACAGCGARIGKYSWRGLQCACTKWVVPAFMLQRSKVDACVPVLGGGAVGPMSATPPAASAFDAQLPRRTFASFSSLSSR